MLRSLSLALRTMSQVFSISPPSPALKRELSHVGGQPGEGARDRFVGKPTGAVEAQPGVDLADFFAQRRGA